jgi:hypothetical protein
MRDHALLNVEVAIILHGMGVGVCCDMIVYTVGRYGAEGLGG